MQYVKVTALLRSFSIQNSHRIQNDWKNVTSKMVKYNNQLVDSVVINEIDINLETVEGNVNQLFEPNVLKNYQSILKSPIIDTTMNNKIWLEGQAKQITDMVGVEYTERIGKNVKAIQKVLQDVDVNISKYEQMTKKFPKASRLKIVEKAMEKGQNWKGHTYSYKELENMNKGITKFIDNRSRQDKYTLNYDEALENGEQPVKKEKTWIWSGLQNTRHSGMDGETVPLKDSFTVINEQNGDTDGLMFPGDLNNDRNGCSNICNCDCNVVYL